MENETITVYIGSINKTIDSHKLLLKAAMLHTNFPEIELSVVREIGKKPYFTSHHEVKFSVSHSDSYWICAFANDEVGIDIQIHNKTTRFLSVSKRFFSPFEISYLENSNNIEAMFYKLWARKEAVVKMLGVGIASNFSKFSAINDSFSFMDKSIHLYDLLLPIDDKYSACLSYTAKADIKIVTL